MEGKWSGVEEEWRGSSADGWHKNGGVKRNFLSFMTQMMTWSSWLGCGDLAKVPPWWTACGAILRGGGG